MSKFVFLLLGLLLSLGTSAFQNRARACGQIEAPYSIINLSKQNTSAPGKPYDPYIVAHQIVERSGKKLGAATVVRFATPAGQTTCQLAVNFPEARFKEVQDGEATWETPVQLSIFKLGSLSTPYPSYDELDILPGPLLTVVVQPGQQIIETEACDSSADYLIEIPSSISGNMGASWKNEILVTENNLEDSLGLFLHYNC